MTRRPSMRNGWLAMVGGCAALGLLSLLVLPRNLAYDPWSWLIWGREIIHLDLDTRDASTAVKPLPIFINTLFAPFGSRAEPEIWMFFARTATLLSLALAFRLGRRIGGIGAGLVAAVGLAISDEYLGYLFIAGMSEPMATAAVLAAVDNHLAANRRWAFAWLVAAGLLRPEVWPFLILYSLWFAYPSFSLRPLTWRPALTGPRAAAILLAVAIPPSWFVIDFFGARQFFRSAGAATHESQGGPLLSREPGLATIRETWTLMSGQFVVLFLLAFAVAVVAWIRRRTWRAPGPNVCLAIGALAWLVLDALLAQGRFATGAPRYLLPGVALAAVVAGGFVADTIRAVLRVRPDSRALMAVGVALTLGVVGILVPRVVRTGRQVHAGVVVGRQDATLQGNLTEAIALAGGRTAILACGPIVTKNFQVPLLAWQLDIPVGTVGYQVDPSGTVIEQAGSPEIPPEYAARYHKLGIIGPYASRWTVVTTCPPGR